MKKKNKLKKTNIIVALFLFIFIICISFLVFIKSDLFNLKNIDIKGNRILNEEEIIKVLKIRKGRNIFSYDIDEISKNIEGIRYIEKVDVNRKFFDTIEINIKEKQVSGVLEKNGCYYIVDQNLNYIDEVKNKEILEKYKKINIDFSILNNNLVYEDEEDYNYLKKILNILSKQNMDKKIKEISFDNNKIVCINIKKDIQALLLKGENIEQDIIKLTKILLDLQNRNISRGKIDMSYKNYVLYSY